MCCFTEDNLGPLATSLLYIFESSGPEMFVLVKISSSHHQNKRTRDIFWKVREPTIWYWNWKRKSLWRCPWLLTPVAVWGFLQRWVPTAFPAQLWHCDWGHHWWVGGGKSSQSSRHIRTGHAHAGGSTWGPSGFSTDSLPFILHWAGCAQVDLTTKASSDTVVGRWERCGGSSFRFVWERTVLICYECSKAFLGEWCCLLLSPGHPHRAGDCPGAVLHVAPIGLLDDSGWDVFLLPSEGGCYWFIGCFWKISCHKFLLHICLQGIQLPRFSQDFLGEGKQDVQTVDLISRDQGQVHLD